MDLLPVSILMWLIQTFLGQKRKRKQIRLPHCKGQRSESKLYKNWRELHRSSHAMTGRPWQALHWLRRGLADYNPNSANPSDVGANIVYHDPPPRVVAPGLARSLFRGWASKAPPVSLAWAGTYPHGWIHFSRCGERFFPVHSIAAGRGGNLSWFQKFFHFFRRWDMRKSTALAEIPSFFPISLLEKPQSFR